MIRFFVRRLLCALVLVLVVLVVSSASLVLAPGDVTAQLGPFASASEIAGTRARFDLDRSLSAQWIVWMSRAIRLDFGESFLYNRPVRGLIGRAAANTAALAVVALLAATLVGIPLGMFTGSRRGAAAALVRGISLACLSVPPLLTSLLLVFVAATTRWFPAGGMTSADALDSRWSAWLADVAIHLPLPAAGAHAADCRHLRAAAGAVDDRGAPSALCAGGGGPRRVAALLSGSFVVEFVTAWPGLGRLMYEALRARDIYLVAGCAAMGGLFLACGSLVGDLLLAAADPRFRDASARQAH